MSIADDKKFIRNLNKYLNPNDVNIIITAFSQPIEGGNINKRTGRRMIGVCATRNRKLLTEGSLLNYKSVILKFARFKYEKVGKDKSIDVSIVKNYYTDILSKDKKHQTILTNVRILNKNIFGPLLKQELPMPQRISSSLISDMSIYFNNKAQLTHEEVARTLKYLWDNNWTNREHIYKMILIYYSGLRHAEAQALTIKDIIDGWARDVERAIIIVRRGKNNIARHILLLEGAPTDFFNDKLLHFLDLKILQLMQCSKSWDEILSTPLFHKSQYQSTQKTFKEALKHIVMKYSNIDNNRNIKQLLKGAGIHSIRTDYCTRMLSIIYQYTQGNPFITLKLVGLLLGHKNPKVTYRHYVNLGYNTSETNFINKLVSQANNDMKKFCIANKTNNSDKNNNNSLLSNINKLLSHSSFSDSIASQLLGNQRKSHENLKNILKYRDNMNIFNIENEHCNNECNNTNIFNNNSDMDTDYDDNDDESNTSVIYNEDHDDVEFEI